MTKRMLIDASHAEETRVVMLDGNRLEDYDVETAAKRQLKGNIYLAKIVRVEPSLQAAFVEYGGNRHGFLAFGEIHPDYFQIPVADRQRLIAQQEEEAEAERRAEEESSGDEDEPETADIDQRTMPLGAGASEFDAGPPPGENAGHEYSENGRSEDGHSEDGRSEDGHTDGEASDGEPSDGMHAGLTHELNAELDGERRDAAQSSDATDHDDAHAADDRNSSDEGGSEHAGSDDVGGEQAARRSAQRMMRHYKIQEVIRRRQVILIQVVKEERGSKGAALTSYISLAGRYCVLMPNSPRGGGVSRKITSAGDRKRLKEITSELAIPKGMALIVRTAGAQRPRPEIKRDCEYLLRLWDDIRDTTMASMAPALIHEEASLIKRAIRDVYSSDVDEILVDGEEGWRAARGIMRMLMPAHARKVQLWRENQPLFARNNVEGFLDAMLNPTVQLKSGGYLVINQTEALVAIDVNSGRSTRERGIEETATRTNLEAADEVARQLRLRDLAGLIVIDFIDMESRKHNLMVERRMKDALRQDRARIQVGAISHFGLMEMSRQRLRPSLVENSFVGCPHCNGTGLVRGTESSALHVLRGIETIGTARDAAEIAVHVAGGIALYILNHKREWLAEIERRCMMQVNFEIDDSLQPPLHRIVKTQVRSPGDIPAEAALRPTVTDAEFADDFADDNVADDEPVARAPSRQAPSRDDASHSAPGARTRGDDTSPGARTRGDDASPGARTRDAEARPPRARDEDAPAAGTDKQAEEEGERKRKRRRRRRRGGKREGEGEGDTRDAAAGSDTDHDPDAGDEDMPDGIAHVASEAAPAVDQAAENSDMSDAPPLAEQGEREGGSRPRRGRRSGRRRRRDDDAPADANAAPDAPAPYVNTPYQGPTPADPFVGTFDIFDVLERSEEAYALNTAGSASLHASLQDHAHAMDDEPAPAVADEPHAEQKPEPEVEQPAAPAIEPTLVDDAEPARQRRSGWWKR